MRVASIASVIWISSYCLLLAEEQRPNVLLITAERDGHSIETKAVD